MGKFTWVLFFFVLLANSVFAEHAQITEASNECQLDFSKQRVTLNFFPGLLPNGGDYNRNVGPPRADRYLLEWYAKALRCPSNSTLAATYRNFLDQVSIQQTNGTYSSISHLKTPVERAMLEELLHALKLSYPIMSRASESQKKALTDWVFNRVRDMDPEHSVPPNLYGKDARQNFLQTPLQQALLGPGEQHAAIAGLLTGDGDPALLFQKHVLGLTASAQKEVAARPRLNINSYQLISSQLISTDQDTVRAALLYERLADILRLEGAFREDSGPWKDLWDTLQGEYCKADHGGQLKSDTPAAAAVTALCQNKRFFALIKAPLAAAGVASQLEAQARSLRHGLPVQGSTRALDELLDQTGRSLSATIGDFAPAEISNDQLAKNHNLFLPWLVDAPVAGGAINPRSLHADVFGLRSQSGPAAARALVLRQRTLVGAGSLPRPAHYFVVARPANEVTAPRAGAKDASGIPYPPFWSPRKFAYAIDGKQPTYPFDQAEKYIVAAAADPLNIEDTELVFANFSPYERLHLRGQLLDLYSQIHGKNYRGIQTYYPADAKYPQQALLKAIANMVKWLDLPAQANSLTAQEATVPYQNYVEAEALAKTPWLSAEFEDDANKVLATQTNASGIVFGFPAPLRQRLSKLPKDTLQTLAELAHRARIRPDLARYLSAALLNYGTPGAVEYRRTLSAELAQLRARNEPPSSDKLRDLEEILYPLQWHAAPTSLSRQPEPRDRSLTEAERAFAAGVNASTLPVDLDRWIQNSDPAAIERLRARLDSSPYAQAREALASREAVISRHFQSALANPSTAAAVPDLVLRSRAQRVLALLRANATRVDAPVLQAELAAIARARNRSAPSAPASALDYLDLLQASPAAFESAVSKLPAEERKDLAFELRELGGVGYYKTTLPRGTEDREIFQQVASLALQTLDPHGETVNHAGFNDTLNARAAAHEARRRDTTARLCFQGKNDGRTFLEARRALSDPDPQAELNALRRTQTAKQNYPIDKYSLAEEDGLAELADRATYDLEGMRKVLRNDYPGTGVYLDPVPRQTLAERLDRLIAERRAANFDESLALAIDDPDKLVAHTPPAERGRLAQRLSTISADAMALAKRGCGGDWWANLRLAQVKLLLAGENLDPTDRAFAEAIWRMDPSSRHQLLVGLYANPHPDTGNEQAPAKLPDFLIRLQRVQAAMAKHAVGGEANELLARVQRETEQTVVDLFESQLKAVRTALETSDNGKLRALRELFLQKQIHPYLLALAVDDAQKPLLAKSLSTKLSGVLKEYENELNAMAALLDESRRAAFLYRCKGGRDSSADRMLLPFDRNASQPLVMEKEVWERDVKNHFEKLAVNFAKHQDEARRAASNNVLNGSFFVKLWDAWESNAEQKPLVTERDKQKNQTLASIEAQLSDLRRLGLPPEAKQEINKTLMQALERDSAMQTAGAKGFANIAYNIMAAPTMLLPFPTIAIGGGLRARLLIPPALSFGVGGGFEIAKQYAMARDAGTPFKVDWIAALKAGGRNAAVGGVVGLTGLVKGLQPYVMTGMVVIGTEQGLVHLALNLQDGKRNLALVNAAEIAVPFLGVAAKKLRGDAGAALTTSEAPPNVLPPRLSLYGGVQSRSGASPLTRPSVPEGLVWTTSGGVRGSRPKSPYDPYGMAVPEGYSPGSILEASRPSYLSWGGPSKQGGFGGGVARPQQIPVADAPVRNLPSGAPNERPLPVGPLAEPPPKTPHLEPPKVADVPPPSTVPEVTVPTGPKITPPSRAPELGVPGWSRLTPWQAPYQTGSWVDTAFRLASSALGNNRPGNIALPPQVPALPEKHVETPPRTDQFPELAQKPRLDDSQLHEIHQRLSEARFETPLTPTQLEKLAATVRQTLQETHGAVDHAGHLLPAGEKALEQTLAQAQLPVKPVLEALRPLRGAVAEPPTPMPGPTAGLGGILRWIQRQFASTSEPVDPALWQRMKDKFKVGMDKQGLNFAMDRHSVQIMKELPSGIPPELVPACARLNIVMADNERFARWLLALESEIAKELKGLPNPTRRDRFDAVERVVRRRAKAAGWPDDILVLNRYMPDELWRPMLSNGKLFIDTRFNNLQRRNDGTIHTEGAHILHLIYAAEQLAKVPGLKVPGLADEPVMRTLMRYMSDTYRDPSGTLRTIDNLDWGPTGIPYDGQSLWLSYFDAVLPEVVTGFNRPEIIGEVYHELINLREIENWSKVHSTRFMPPTPGTP